MAELKTKQTETSVDIFLQSVEDEKKRADCLRIMELMREVTGHEPKMWGETMIGFGSYHYKYASGHEGDAMLTGFSPRKQNITLYITAGFEQYADLTSKLGKHKTGKVCLYINKLADVDETVLRELVKASFEHMVKTNHVHGS
ncbi:MAG: DUF1801 domain-containing protein [Chloroflexota bacterium]|nr:DUF1801 domain-containing protein [Chloroflexota bacterium]